MSHFSLSFPILQKFAAVFGMFWKLIGKSLNDFQIIFGEFWQIFRNLQKMLRNLKWNTQREISYLHTLMIFPVHPYLNLMWLWSSCSMRSSLPYLEFLPSHWGNSILWPIPPLIRSDGITHDIIAWKFNIGLILMLMKMELTMNWQSQVKLQLFI